MFQPANWCPPCGTRSARPAYGRRARRGCAGTPPPVGERRVEWTECPGPAAGGLADEVAARLSDREQVLARWRASALRGSRERRAPGKSSEIERLLGTTQARRSRAAWRKGDRPPRAPKRGPLTSHAQPPTVRRPSTSSARPRCGRVVGERHEAEPSSSPWNKPPGRDRSASRPSARPRTCPDNRSPRRIDPRGHRPPAPPVVGGPPAAATAARVAPWRARPHSAMSSTPTATERLPVPARLLVLHHQVPRPCAGRRNPSAPW